MSTFETITKKISSTVNKTEQEAGIVKKWFLSHPKFTLLFIGFLFGLIVGLIF